MKIPRFRIAWIMVFIAIVALNFGVIRALDTRTPTNLILLVGAIPMANVLAVGMLIGQGRLRSHPFLLGFEVLGVTALAIFAALTYWFPITYMIDYIELLLQPLRRTIGPDRHIVLVATLCPVAGAMLGLPQLVLALIGGFLSRRILLQSGR